MKNNLNENHFRQGDVGIYKLASIKDYRNLKELKPVNGRAILAYGEATGHHHSIDLKRYPNTKLYEIDSNTMLLELKEAVKIEHQEHATIFIPAGDYEIHRQVEYDPEGERRVQD